MGIHLIWAPVEGPHHPSHLLRVLHAEMNFLDARLFDEPSDVVGVDPATRQDRDPPLGLNDEPADLLGALRRRRRATRRQYPLDPEVDEPLERFGAIREDV